MNKILIDIKIPQQYNKFIKFSEKTIKNCTKSQ